MVLGTPDAPCSGFMKEMQVGVVSVVCTVVTSSLKAVTL